MSSANKPQSISPPPLPARNRGWLIESATALHRFFDYVFGLITILLALAACSAIPIVHLLGLGYLLDASARIAKSGRVRDGFIGLKPAAWLGRLLVFGYLVFLPIRLVHSFWVDSQIIEPSSEIASRIGVLLVGMATLTVGGLLWSMIRGGKLWNYIWPSPLRFLRWLGEPKSWKLIKERWGRPKALYWIWDYFKLGFFGFVGGVLWLLLPVGLLFVASQIPNQFASLLVSLLGSVVLSLVILFLPFLQCRYATSRKFSEFGKWNAVRKNYRHAPIAFWFALTVTLLFALPLYLLKIELTPREVAWLPNLVFVVFMFPARLLIGWAMSRSVKALDRRHWVFRWMGRLAIIPAVGIYVLVVWLNQFLSWHGSYSLFEQHAFLLPAPMLGL